MKYVLVLSLYILSLQGHSQETKSVQFFQTDWGRTSSWDTFCAKTKAAGYDGIEIWFPNNQEDEHLLKAALKKYDLKLGLINGTDKSLPFVESLEAYEVHLLKLASWSPEYINCHTGSDFFTFEQNKAFIKVATKISEEYDIPIYHETHRGRFSYNLPDTKTYIEKIPKLKLNLDISHWMVVHESLLLDQNEALLTVMDRTYHLHARVGHAEGPQVNDPQAPEWKSALDRHLNLWEKIIRKYWETNNTFSLTTEFGPAGYMPTLPYTMAPVADQWKANIFMMKMIKERLNIE